MESTSGAAKWRRETKNISDGAEIGGNWRRMTFVMRNDGMMVNYDVD